MGDLQAKLNEALDLHVPEMSNYSETEKKQSPAQSADIFKGRKPEKLHVQIEELQKVALSPDGIHLFFGGDGLSVLDMSGDKMRLAQTEHSKSTRC